jgi:uncharacterized membrane protein YkoI
MRTARLLVLTALGLQFLAPTAGAQDLIERRPREERHIEPRGISLDQAVQMAQRRYQARAVKAETVNHGDRRVHRIRLMSTEGKVWHVHVDAQTGAMN